MGREPAVVPGLEGWTILSDLIAGAIAGICCDALLHPLDTVKSRLHIQSGPPFKYRSMFHGLRLIFQEEGARKGLYAGFGAVLAGTVPTHAVMFAGYKAIKRLGENEFDESDKEVVAGNTEKQLAVIDFASASVGEVFALPFYVPAEVIAKRMQVAKVGPARNYDSTLHAARSILRSEGPRGLLTGFWPTLLRDVPYTALQFSFFTAAKDRYRMYSGRYKLTNAEATVLGVGVGATAAILTNPCDVIKTRFMTQSSGSEKKYHSILQCVRRIVAEEGPAALMRGVFARVLWVGPGSGITLAVYERCSQYLRDKWHLEEKSRRAIDIRADHRATLAVPER